VTNVNDAPVGVPTITGTVTEDQTLTADTSGISDADGLGAFSYQWLRDGAAIGGATASTYTLGDADVGSQVSVQVSYTDGQGTNESLTSAQTAAVANVNDPGTVVIDNLTPSPGATLTASVTDPDGATGAISYQWLRNGSAIGGATGATYTLGDADVGSQISVQASYTDGHGTAESVTSAQTAPVGNVNNAPVGSPTTDGQVVIDNSFDTTTITNVTSPGTVDINNPTTLVTPQTVPADTQSSPLPEHTEPSPNTASKVSEQEEIPKEEAPQADVQEGSNPASNQPSQKGDVANRSDTRTELASLVLTRESSPNIETASGERLAALQKQDLRPGGPLKVMRALDYKHLRDSLDAVKQQVTSEIRLGKMYLGSAVVASIGLSVGYVVWLLRGGMLLASLLSSMPAWQYLDPLPILAGKKKKEDDRSDDDESLESIVDKKPQPINPKKKTADPSSDAERKRR
jgi:hypothetical protein